MQTEMLPSRHASATTAAGIHWQPRTRPFEAPLDGADRAQTLVTFQRDQTIYTEGDAAGCWYVVKKGTVRTSMYMADGRRHINEFLFPEDLFGFEAGSVRRLAAEAVTDVVLARYPRESIERLWDRDRALARRLLGAAADSLNAAQGRLVLLGRKSALERVASFLIEMAERSPGANGADVELTMSRAEIADHLGLTTETVSRVMSQLRRDRVIALRHSNEILFRDADGLEDLAG